MGKAHGNSDPTKLKRIQDTERALELRRQGYTFRQIGHEMKITHRAAHKLVTDAFKATQKYAKAQAEEMVQLHLERLEGTWKSLQGRIDKGESRAAEVGLKVLEREAKLLGLDAPAKQEVSVSYSHLSDAELLDEARRLQLDVHIHPPKQLLLPGEAALPPAVEVEVQGLLMPPKEGIPADGEQ